MPNVSPHGTGTSFSSHTATPTSGHAPLTCGNEWRGRDSDPRPTDWVLTVLGAPRGSRLFLSPAMHLSSQYRLPDIGPYLGTTIAAATPTPTSMSAHGRQTGEPEMQGSNRQSPGCSQRSVWLRRPEFTSATYSSTRRSRPANGPPGSCIRPPTSRLPRSIAA